MTSTRRRRSRVRKAAESDLLQKDVAAMIGDADTLYEEERQQLAHDIIVVVRERVLNELATYARENIR